MKKSELLKALEIVKPGLANKEIVEQSTSFAFINNRVVTYNDELSISHPVKGLDTFSGAIRAEEFYQLLARLKKDELTITSEGNEVQMSAGRAKASFRLESEIKLPLKSLNEQGEWHDLPETFNRHIGFTSRVCSSDFSRPILTCVNIRQDGKIEASDGYRIVRCTGDELPLEDFLLPGTLAQQVKKQKPFQIAKGGEGWIHFRTQDETIISCRIFNEKYPNVDHLVNMEGEKLTFPKTITGLIDRAEIFSKKDHYLDEVVLISIGKKRITVQSASDVGSYEEEANMRYKGPDLNFSITPGLFKDILEVTQDCVYSENRIKFEGDDWVYVGMLRE